VSTSSLIKAIKDVFGDSIQYVPYDLRSTTIMVGMPPVPIKGLVYIVARHNNPQTRYVKSLTGHGVYVANNDRSGTIELGIVRGTVSCAAIQVTDLVGVPYPIAITDTATGGTSSVLAASCRRVGTPEWRRAALPDLAVYTFAADKLIISDGLMMKEDV